MRIANIYTHLTIQLIREVVVHDILALTVNITCYNCNIVDCNRI